MKVGDLVTRKRRLHIGLPEEYGIVTERATDQEADDFDPHDSVWVRWSDKPDWDMEWPTELEVLGSVGQ